MRTAIKKRHQRGLVLPRDYYEAVKDVVAAARSVRTGPLGSQATDSMKQLATALEKLDSNWGDEDL